MTWFRVDDDLAFHRKVVAAGNAAMGLWVRAGAWSAQHLTDGFVPDHMIMVIGTRAQRQKLISAGLWIKVEGGCQFHEWSASGRQPTSISIHNNRRAAAERQAKYRQKSGRFSESSQVDGLGDGVTEPLVTPSVTPLVTGGVTPTPTRPVKEPLGDTGVSAEVRKGARQDRQATQTIIDAWVASSNKPPPRKLRYDLGRQIDELLDEGIAQDDIRRGVERWATRGLSPSLLPAVVNDVMNGQAVRSVPSQRPGRPSHDDKVRGWQALKERDDRPAIEG